MHNVLHIAGSSFSCSLVFYMEVVSVALYMDNPATSSPFSVPFPGYLFLKYTQSPTLKLGGLQFIVFCACLSLFSSRVLLAMVGARQCNSRSRHPDSGPHKNCYLGSCNFQRGKLGSLPQTWKKGVSVVARCGVTR